MRLRQCISYIHLLKTAIPDYDEELITEIFLISNVVNNYDEIERPAKLEKMMELVNKLRSHNEQVVIWSNFVESLKLIKRTLKSEGYQTELIYGATPTQNSTVRDERTREEIIRQFVNPDGSIDILVANPAACAESISLHKTCSHAIYYDLSYNCAQYLQSLDRIHRVGGSEDKEAHYYFLLYANTIDLDILTNVQKKAYNMSSIIDQDYAVYSLDMFEGNEDLEAYERLFARD
jgi:SNF2 family DNA or RNA helicase